MELKSLQKERATQVKEQGAVLQKPQSAERGSKEQDVSLDFWYLSMYTMVLRIPPDTF
jgi:hypothetical protein